MRLELRRLPRNRKSLRLPVPAVCRQDRPISRPRRMARRRHPASPGPIRRPRRRLRRQRQALPRPEAPLSRPRRGVAGRRPPC